MKQQKPKELEWADRFDEYWSETILRLKAENIPVGFAIGTADGIKNFIQSLLTQQRTELEKKFKKDKKQPKDKLGDDFTKFLESEGYQVRDCEVEKCKHKWIQIEYDLMKCLKCNKVKKL